MSWWKRLQFGVKKIGDGLGDRLRVLFNKIDANTLDDIEDLLIQSDMGPIVAASLRKEIAKLSATSQDPSEILAQVVTLIEEKLTVCQKPLVLEKNSLNVVMMVGVNGAGKTTTISKLAHFYQKQGHKVALAACDTFRAGATDQLAIWAERLHITVHQGPENADPSSVVYKAITEAQKDDTSLLLIDTAGRLHNKQHLMDELIKMVRVINKLIPAAPPHIILVLDGTTGQNAITQVELFSKAIPISGLIMTKLDGTAKGGIVVSLANQFQLPIYGVSMGEAVDDLQPFDAHEFSQALLGIT